ncbi:hypothetical protein GCM10017714_33680 [Curtobacterium pusillum]|nr:hypothetical protein GCM10017610_18830 [Curtobacterium pusillum]
MLGARVNVDGQTIRGDWDGTETVAVANITIAWGRDSLYDETEPDTCTLYVIDPTGDWLGASKRTGSKLEVYQVANSRRVFLGAVSGTDMRQIKVVNPKTGQREPRWFVKLTASGRLGALSESVFPGEMGAESLEGLGGWGESNINSLQEKYLSRGMSTIVSDIGRAPSVGDSSVLVRRMNQVTASERANSLDLVARIYRAGEPLGFVNYDPETNAIACGITADAGTLRLVYSGGVTQIAPTGSNSVAVSADLVAVNDSDDASTAAGDSVDAVSVAYVWYGKDPKLTDGAQKRTVYIDSLIERTTDRNATSNTHRVLEIDSQLMNLQQSEFGYDVGPTNKAPGWLADGIVAKVNTLNGQLRLPPVTFDEKRLPLDSDALTWSFLRPVHDGRAIYFTGSKYNTLAGAGPMFQIIGGTLTFDGAWSHEVTLAPAVGNAARADLSIGDLFGSTSAATLGSFDSPIRLGDFATISQGL